MAADAWGRLAAVPGRWREQGAAEVVEQAAGHAGPYRRLVCRASRRLQPGPAHPPTSGIAGSSRPDGDAIAALHQPRVRRSSGCRQLSSRRREGARNRPRRHRPLADVVRRGQQQGGAADHPALGRKHRRGVEAIGMSGPTLTQPRCGSPRRPGALSTTSGAPGPVDQGLTCPRLEPQAQSGPARRGQHLPRPPGGH